MWRHLRIIWPCLVASLGSPRVSRHNIHNITLRRHQRLRICAPSPSGCWDSYFKWILAAYLFQHPTLYLIFPRPKLKIKKTPKKQRQDINNVNTPSSPNLFPNIQCLFPRLSPCLDWPLAFRKVPILTILQFYGCKKLKWTPKLVIKRDGREREDGFNFLEQSLWITCP